MPKAEKTIGLPLENMLLDKIPQELVNFLRLYREKIEKGFKDLKSDITTIEIGSGSAIVVGDWIYFGDIDSVGSWRVGRESGKWVGQFWDVGTSAYISRGGFTQS